MEVVAESAEEKFGDELSGLADYGEVVQLCDGAGWLSQMVVLGFWSGRTDYFFVPLALVSDLSHKLK